MSWLNNPMYGEAGINEATARRREAEKEGRAHRERRLGAGNAQAPEMEMEMAPTDGLIRASAPRRHRWTAGPLDSLSRLLAGLLRHRRPTTTVD